MAAVEVRGLVFGAGAPKICLPLAGRTYDELCQCAEEARVLQPDLVELRADYYTDVTNTDERRRTLSRLRESLPYPILFTLRDKSEGGVTALGESTRLGIISDAIRSGAVDLVDIELRYARAGLHSLITEARAHGVKVVVSAHFFSSTPTGDACIALLTEMRAIGADFGKLAVTPESPADLITLFSVTERMSAELPLITMSMGGLGVASRVIGGLFGSVITFGCGSSPTAAGQLPVPVLRDAMKPFY